MTLQEQALQIATAEIGHQEEPLGSNWGPHVQKYLASVGIKSPAYWCMGFVYWCFNEAAATLKVINPLPKTGHVLTCAGMASKLHKVSTPQPGDIFILDLGGGHGHTGIVNEVDGDLFTAVEGNSNDDGSRNGIEVCIPKQRKISSIKVFLRYL